MPVHSQRIKCVIVLIIIFLSITSMQSAQAIIFPDMKMNATPNPVGSGARALGFGGAFIALADDATAASWNPAALLRLKRPEVSMVGSYFSGNSSYDTSILAGEGQIKDLTGEQKHLNYLSAVFPLIIFRRNMVFSLNYQHLYEFSMDTSYQWKYSYHDPNLGNLIDIPMNSHKKQEGTLNTLSPAVAIQIIPSLYIGLTANFWLKDELNNHWENLNIAQGEGIIGGMNIKTYAEFYERYDFSGFNTHIGLLWRPNVRYTIGGVIKTPFKADIKRKSSYLSIEEYPQNPDLNTYYPPEISTENLTLEMPISYGLGASIRFSKTFLLALDCYHTRWQDYLLSYSTGEKISPINNKPADKAGIKPTTQVRCGVEYLVRYPNPTIPIRFGAFYDPQPSDGSVDDFYGISLGTGISINKFSFDMAYQFRFGQKRQAEEMLMKDIPSDIRQHYLYTSFIFYF